MPPEPDNSTKPIKPVSPTKPTEPVTNTAVNSEPKVVQPTEPTVVRPTEPVSTSESVVSSEPLGQPEPLAGQADLPPQPTPVAPAAPASMPVSQPEPLHPGLQATEAHVPGTPPVPLANTMGSGPTTAATPTQTSTVPPVSKRGSKKLLIIIAVVVLVLIAAIVVAVIVWPKPTPDSSGPSGSTGSPTTSFSTTKTSDVTSSGGALTTGVTGVPNAETFQGDVLKSIAQAERKSGEAKLVTKAPAGASTTAILEDWTVTIDGKNAIYTVAITVGQDDKVTYTIKKKS